MQGNNSFEKITRQAKPPRKPDEKRTKSRTWKREDTKRNFDK